MGLMPVTDSMFLVPETRDQPMHVGGLQVFQLPPGAGREWLAGVYRRSTEVGEVAPVFRKRAYRSALTAGQWAWAHDPTLDLEHHVRHAALPRPGRVRELFALVSRLHGTLLDRKRPLWEANLIEGLEGDRFAVYTKVHHALMDGVSAMRLLQECLSTDPEAETGPWWAERRRAGRAPHESGGMAALPAQALGVATDLMTFSPRMLGIVQRGLWDTAAVLPGQAPRCILNSSISASRRFAGDAWPMARLRAVATAAGATINDVVLAMCAAALREHLLDLGELPDAPLIAMTPVSLRSADAVAAGGNAVGTILCNLGTHLPDAEDRLELIRLSMRRGKDAIKGLSQLQISALSAAVMAPLLFNGLIGLHRAPRQPFNLVISNVPGPEGPLYYDGARLEGTYPLSIPAQGQAMNITVTSYAGMMQFGLVGCRRTVPHLQRMLGGLENGLAELEKAYVL